MTLPGLVCALAGTLGFWRTFLITGFRDGGVLSAFGQVAAGAFTLLRLVTGFLLSASIFESSFAVDDLAGNAAGTLLAFKDLYAPARLL